MGPVIWPHSFFIMYTVTILQHVPSILLLIALGRCSIHVLMGRRTFTKLKPEFFVISLILLFHMVVVQPYSTYGEGKSYGTVSTLNR